jgi:glycosyltransferase involved in cell wall biosynthesis
MKLTVIVPAWNLEAYIGECLQSVVDQEVDFEYEVVVCDDKSTDGTASVIADFANRYPQIRSIFKSVNQGLAQNMTTLLEAATGEYIAYLDGDDLMLPGKLQKQVDHLDQHPDCQMVFHESDVFNSDTGAHIRYFTREFYNWHLLKSRTTIQDLILYSTYIQASSVLFRRHDHLVDTVAKECRIILDYPFQILNAGYLNAHIDYLPEVLGRYRIHQNSFGSQTARSLERREQVLQDVVWACKAAQQFGVSDDIITRGVNHQLFAAALYFLQRDDFQRFKTYINQSTDGVWFFDSRHEMAFRQQQHPDLVKSGLFN